MFLDDVAEPSLSHRPKLLRLIRERRFQRVGGRETLTLGARTVAATNAELSARVADGRFRDDLHFRLGLSADAEERARTAKA